MWSRSSSSRHQVATREDDPEKVFQQVQELSDWLSANPQVNGCNSYENLHFFLRTSKFDVERTKKKLKTYYQMRAERTEWFDNRDPKLPEIQELLDLGVFLPIGPDAEQRMVVVIRTAAHDPKKHSQNNVFKVSHGYVPNLTLCFHFYENWMTLRSPLCLCTIHVRIKFIKSVFYVD